MKHLKLINYQFENLNSYYNTENENVLVNLEFYFQNLKTPNYRGNVDVFQLCVSTKLKVVKKQGVKQKHHFSQSVVSAAVGGGSHDRERSTSKPGDIRSTVFLYNFRHPGIQQADVFSAQSRALNQKFEFGNISCYLLLFRDKHFSVG